MAQIELASLNSSLPSWETLEDFVRLQVQGLIQRVLLEEVDELLGRAKSERRSSDEPPVYRNGFGKERQLTTPAGTIAVRRPRVRGLAERFESRLLPLFKRRTQAVDRLLPELYLHGLAEGDFDQALRALLGERAPISAATVARLKGTWQTEFETWSQRSLEGREPVYLWVDGIYVKAGLEKEKAALLVVIAAWRDGTKSVLAVRAGHRESTESWAELFRDLKDRGLPAPKLVVGDGALGLWSGLAQIYPEAQEQRCWNHRIINVLDKLPKKLQSQGLPRLREVMYATTESEAERAREKFAAWCRERGHAPAGEALMKDWERLVAYYRFPKPHWKHLRTTNPVESPFAAVRLRTGAARRYRKVENATAVLWKLLMVAERTFRRLDGHELLADVHAGLRFKDGERLTKLKDPSP